MIIYLFFFFINQVRLILQGGTTWDDLKLLEITPRIIEKFFLFFSDSSNPFLSEFISNFEFYGFISKNDANVKSLIKKIENVNIPSYKTYK